MQLRATRLTAIASAVKKLFSPASLFSAGEQGVWYDPSDMSTMFQDAAGTTPVTAVEQPVGLILDKSKGLVLGSELVTNGTFAENINGWTAGSEFSSISWVAGKLRVSTNSTIPQGKSAYQSLPVVAGKTYKVSGNATIVEGSFTTVHISLRDGVSAATSNLIATTMLTMGDGSEASFIYTATSTTTLYIHCRIFNTTAPATVDYDNISLRELPGNHATQTTATSRPVLSARYNLVLSTEDPTTTFWGRSRVTAQKNITDPFVGNTAFAIYETTETGIHHLTSAENAIQTAEITYRISCYLKYAGAQFVVIGMNPFSNRGICVDIVNGSIVAFGPTTSNRTITTVGDGWYMVSFDILILANLPGNYFSIAINNSANSQAQSFTGDPSRGVLVWRLDTRVANTGVNLPAYQRVNTATDYDTAGFPHYLRFDGVDDWLVTPTITPGTDKVQVFAGVRKLSATTFQIISELSTNASLNNGAFAVYGPSSSATNYAFSLRGTDPSPGIDVFYAPGGYTHPVSNVLTCSYDIGGAGVVTEVIPRINSMLAQSNGSGGTAGTGNFGNYPLYIGRRGGTSLPFNGQLYGLIVRFGANLPAWTIASTETWLNGKTRAY